jgi:hypothetical protein
MNSSIQSSPVNELMGKPNQNENQNVKIENNEKEIEQFSERQENMDNIRIMEEKMGKAQKKVPFWSENPNILFSNKHLAELYPTEGMTYNQKLNAITRTVMLLVLATFFYSGNFRILLVGIITFLAIFVLHYFHVKEQEKRESKRVDGDAKENFANPALYYLKENNMPIPTDVFDMPDSSNPFSNVLVTDHDYNPDKKPAAPAYNQTVEDDILKQAKQFVNDANPDHPDIADKLFSDMGGNMQLEQSLRPFNSNPSTTIPNDQAAFAEFCYGSMISCKEGNEFACARNLARHVN